MSRGGGGRPEDGRFEDITRFCAKVSVDGRGWLVLRDLHLPSCGRMAQRLTMLQPFADSAKR